MIELLDKFYERVPGDYKQQYCVGQFYWAPVAYLLKRKAQRLRIDCESPHDPRNVNYILEDCDLRHLDLRRNPDHYALKSEEEFYLTVAHKFRPVVVVSRSVEEWKSDGLHYDRCFVVAPAYSLRDEIGVYKCSEKFVLGVQAYEYPSLFYLPEDEQFGIRESVVRFDRIVAVDGDVLHTRGNQRMTTDFVYCISCWLSYYLDGELDENLDAYRKVMLEALHAEYGE